MRRRAELVVDQQQLRDENRNPHPDRVGDTGRRAEARPAQRRHYVLDGHAADPVVAERRRDATPGEPRPGRRVGVIPQQGPHPGIIRRGVQRQPWRIDAIELLAQSIDQPRLLEL